MIKDKQSSDLKGREFANIIESIRRTIERDHYRGYDPYDALNSPLIKGIAFNKYIRIAFIQSLKKMPLNIRPVLGIKKGYNPKGLGLLLWGYTKLYSCEKDGALLIKIEKILDLLQQLKSIGYSGNCWGYNFDWQSRAFYLPKFTPTVVNTSFIGHALIDTYLYTGNRRALEMAIPIMDFILNDLIRSQEDNTICFSYSPKDITKIHNANLLGASLLIRLAKYVGISDIKDIALASLAYSMKYQNGDGSWYYAQTDYQKWIDSFHTGFNLQCIKYFLDEGFGTEYTDSFYRGLNFYKDNFFLNDEIPKYYNDKIYPIDIHSAAQAIVLFSKLGSNFKELRNKIMCWAIQNMRDHKGSFYFQKKRFYTIKIPYMRWSQAWVFHALTEYLINEGR